MGHGPKIRLGAMVLLAALPTASTFPTIGGVAAAMPANHVGPSAASALAPRNVGAGDPERLADLMRRAGFRAEMATDGVGDPMIRSAASGKLFRVMFYECTNNEDCRSIQFRAAFDLADGTTADRMNEWNENERWTRAYVDDEGDPILEYDVNFEGGVSPDNFQDSLRVWERSLGRFIRHVDW